MTDLSPGPSGMGGSPGPISLNRLRGRAVLARARRKGYRGPVTSAAPQAGSRSSHARRSSGDC